ncbi:MAG: hypothetical protein NVS4B3_16820 [Gemmatimonadaceae bacterium]
MLRPRRGFDSLGQVGLVNVADGGHRDVGVLHRVLQISDALPAAPDQRDGDAVVRTGSSLGMHGTGIEDDSPGEGASGAPFEEISTSDRVRLVVTVHCRDIVGGWADGVPPKQSSPFGSAVKPDTYDGHDLRDGSP